MLRFRAGLIDRGGSVPHTPLGRDRPFLLGRCDSKRLKGWTHANTHGSPAKPSERAASTSTTPYRSIIRTPAVIEWGFATF